MHSLRIKHKASHAGALAVAQQVPMDEPGISGLGSRRLGLGQPLGDVFWSGWVRSHRIGGGKKAVPSGNGDLGEALGTQEGNAMTFMVIPEARELPREQQLGIDVRFRGDI